MYDLVWEVLFSPRNNQHVFTCGNDGKLCRLRTDNEDRNIRSSAVPFHHIQTNDSCLSINSCDYHPDGDILLAGSDDGSLSFTQKFVL